MSKSYVFDFYNLYLPKKYSNEKFGITILPLKLAMEFEKKRKKITSPYNKLGWKTAKCHIKAKNEEEALQIAYWLELLYSYAQNRSVFYLSWYPYKKGKKYSSSQAKFINHRENRFSDLIYGTFKGPAFYTRDISLFIDTSLNTMKESSDDKVVEILTTISAYNISKSELAYELKFLTSWIALERLANSHYNVYKSTKSLITKKERLIIKKGLEETLKQYIEDGKKLKLITKSLTRNFLFEHDTLTKINIYFDTMDLGFDEKEIKELLKKLVTIRGKLVHNLDSDLLNKEPKLLQKNRKILEQVIFRLLGINKNIQTKLFMHRILDPKILE